MLSFPCGCIEHGHGAGWARRCLMHRTLDMQSHAFRCPTCRNEAVLMTTDKVIPWSMDCKTSGCPGRMFQQAHQLPRHESDRKPIRFTPTREAPVGLHLTDDEAKDIGKHLRAITDVIDPSPIVRAIRTLAAVKVPPYAPLPVEPTEDWERRRADPQAAKIHALRSALKHLQERHRRSKKAERSMQRTISKQAVRIAELEERAQKHTQTLGIGSDVLVTMNDSVVMLRVESVRWSRDDEPQWSIKCRAAADHSVIA